ncbi:MAG: MFS transporter [Fervidicoccaceae archaeon]
MDSNQRIEKNEYGMESLSRKSLYLVPFFIGLSYSIYSVTIRAKIGSIAKSDYSFMILLTSMETIPGIFSVLSGYYSDRFGKILPLSFGFVASSLLVLFPFIQITLLPIFVFLFITMYMLYTPTIYGMILRKAEGSGKKLGMLLMMFSIGWTCGGFFPSLLSLTGYTDLGFLFSAILLMISAKMLLSKMEQSKKLEDRSVSIYGFKESIKYAWKIILGLILWASGYFLLSGIFSLRLYNSVNNQFEYGVYFTVITGLASIIVRPYAGKLVDKFSPYKVLLSSISAYLGLSLALIWAPPPLVVLLWILPIYPFFDTGSYSLLSRAMPFELQSTAAGIINTSISFGGSINLILYYFLRNVSFEVMLVTDSVLLLLSVVWFTLIFRKK